VDALLSPGYRQIFFLDADGTIDAIIVVIMKSAVLCIALLLAISAHVSAVIRPRYPVRPAPPFRGQLIVIVDDSFEKAGAKAPK